MKVPWRWRRRSRLFLVIVLSILVLAGLFRLGGSNFGASEERVLLDFASSSSLDDNHPTESSLSSITTTSAPHPIVTHHRANASEFECLDDGEELWQARVQRTNQFRDRLCPPSSASVDARSKPIPVVFAFWAKNGVENDPALDMVALAANTAARFNDDVVVIFLNGHPNRPKSSPRHITKKDLPAKLLPNVRLMAAATWDKENAISQAFRSFGPKQYKHKSINGYEYELYCFQRWFATMQVIKQLGYDEVFAADNDVLVLTNVTRDMEQCYGGCDSTGDLVYAYHFRVPVLQRFLDFILDIYRGSYVITVDALAKQYGVVSDMYLHIAFNEHELRSQNSSNAAAKQCANRNPNFVPPANYRFQRVGAFRGSLSRGFLQDELGLPYYYTTTTTTAAVPLLLMPVAHFQGPPNKKILLRCGDGRDGEI